MAWSASKVFTATVEDAFENTFAFDADTDTFKAALFDNSITPSQTVASASTAYGAGVWASGGVSDASGWPAAGRSLTVTSTGSGTTSYTFDSTDTASANSNTTLAATYGSLVYDDSATSPADQGICFNYFGGAQQVTAGSFTIVWHANGVWSIAF
jgi:hypothetical protein